MDPKLANDLAQVYGEEFNQQEDIDPEDPAPQDDPQEDIDPEDPAPQDDPPPADSAAKFTLEDVERISANAAAIAVERARVPVQQDKEDDLDKVIASKFEYGTDQAVVKAAVEIAEERAYKRFVRDFGHVLDANQGRVAVKEVRKHVEIEPELEPYVERATEEYGLKVTGPLDPKQAKAIRALARDLYEDSGSRQEGAARKKVVSTRAVDKSERGASASEEYRLTPDDDAFERAFGSGMAKTIRKQRGEL